MSQQEASRPDMSRQEAQRRLRLRQRGTSRPDADRPEPPSRPERLAITSIAPSVAEGEYPSKRVLNDVVEFSAVVVCDGAVEISAQLRLTDPWGTQSVHPMTRQTGYRFVVEVALTELGTYSWTVDTWIDRAATLRSRIARKRTAGQSTHNEDEELRRLGDDTVSDRVTSRTEHIIVDRLLASFAGWYEFFPRSTGHSAEQPGTLRTCIDRLDYVAASGFDIVYLPPIHPIGRQHRKGVNNAVDSQPDDVGSPWAIGSAEGGHTAIHPDLGTFEDFDDLVRETYARGLEIAMDIAFQCSPDHPWVAEHPEWFSIRPDGSIAYAENPPKQYQDIVPFDFDSVEWRSLWEALADVVRFWHDRGVRVFRIDNPHTKPFRFWEWLITEIKAEDPGVVFLAEAFAHPDVMLQLSRVGFSVSYTHFPWQHSPSDLEHYAHLLSDGDRGEFFRASSWVNTPDILTEELQQGLRQTFEARLLIAATMSASYGVYGPVFELQVSNALANSEEYEHGEKYEVRSWDLDTDHSLRAQMQRINEIRKQYVALQHDRSLVFHHCDNERLVVFSKTAPNRINTTGDRAPILVVANTDHYNAQDGYVRLDLSAFGTELGAADPSATYEVHDLLTDQRFTWHGADNYVRLDPWTQSAHVFAVRRLDYSDTQHELI
ncbi:MAG: putative glycanase or glycogenase with amylase domain [Ilumatobacteraceae bacterium]|nr:putative glycanase or glycogenase with amylase domain [Ilumatobacteraceae bacterium]